MNRWLDDKLGSQLRRIGKKEHVGACTRKPYIAEPICIFQDMDKTREALDECVCQADALGNEIEADEGWDAHLWWRIDSSISIPIECDRFEGHKEINDSTGNRCVPGKTQLYGYRVGDEEGAGGVTRDICPR
jgi:hypothetical protein